MGAIVRCRPPPSGIEILVCGGWSRAAWGETVTMSTPTSQPVVTAAAGSVDAVKVYGKGGTEVRALVTRPQIIFADEPTGNLDSHSSTEILEFMRHAVDEFGQTIVMVTHDPGAASHADRVVFLADGRVVDEMESPTAERILDHLKRLGG